jgi:hypothetical protein
MRSCLHLRATPFLAEGVGACASSPYSFDTSHDTDSHSVYCTSTRTFHIMRVPSFSPTTTLQSWWCSVASVGPGLGRHSHSLVLLGLTSGAGASRFGAALAGLLSPLACSLPIYLAVYYLCRLQMPRSSSCPSPATNRYVRLFPSPPSL